jgi:hypothetical protein
VNGTTLTFNDTSAAMWAYYFYRVTAVNAAGVEGQPSADVGAMRSC